MSLITPDARLDCYIAERLRRMNFPFSTSEYEWIQIKGSAGEAVTRFNKIFNGEKKFAFSIQYALWIHDQEAGVQHSFYDRGILVDDIEDFQTHPHLAHGYWPRGHTRNIFIGIKVDGVKGTAHVQDAVRNLPPPRGVTKVDYGEQLDQGLRVVPRLHCTLTPSWDKVDSVISDHGSEAERYNLFARDPTNKQLYDFADQTVPDKLDNRIQESLQRQAEQDTIIAELTREVNRLRVAHQALPEPSNEDPDSEDAIDEASLALLSTGPSPARKRLFSEAREEDESDETGKRDE
ncbi:hypothetical protein FRB90_003517 [Tulasnella sp. 427]|nr:hypothetical protein FRB90_003517 [Tulasnella sp. 427]